MAAYQHQPVLLEEVIKLINPQANQNFIDATLGGGSYTQALLGNNGPQGQVLSFDLDTEAINAFSEKIKTKQFASRLTVVHDNFANLSKVAMSHGFTKVAGIVADIGLSSYQLDQSGRGISFQLNERLDMRFDRTNQAVDAHFIVNNYSLERLTELFRTFGEEPFAKNIAGKIVRQRQIGLITTTEQLVEVIKISLPMPRRYKWPDHARRIFQALRIAVNHELENLEQFLPQALDILGTGGILAIVSFHSLEDRLVKNFIKAGNVQGKEDKDMFGVVHRPLESVIRKPITASEEELKLNPRSRSAKLRIASKL